jgi:hypothetical protein
VRMLVLNNNKNELKNYRDRRHRTWLVLLFTLTNNTGDSHIIILKFQ